MVDSLKKKTAFLSCALYSALLCSFLFYSSALKGQPDWVWGRDIHTSSPEYSTDVAIDPISGNVVITGVYNSNLSAYYGSSFSGSSKGGFVAKYDPNGNIIWGFKVGSNNNNICNSVVIDSSGNIYVAGTFELTTDFKGTLASPSTNLTSGGQKDVFLAKYNSAGQLLWVRKGGGAGNDEGSSVAINSTGVYISGSYTNSASFGTLNSVANNSTQNMFVCAYDFAGTPLWLADGGTTQPCSANGITADNSAVFVTGEFKGPTLNIYNSSATLAATFTNTASGKNDAYILSFGTSGNFNWGGSIGSTEDETAMAVSVSGNLIYVTGAIKQSANFPSYSSNPVSWDGALDLYLAAIDKTNGITQWVKSGGSNDEGAGLNVANDNVGNVYVSGYFKNSITFTGGPSLNISGGHKEDLFVITYSSTGVFRWLKDAGENQKDEAYGVACRNVNEVYVSGEYAKTPVFGPSTLTVDGGSNAFLAKITCPSILNNIISSSQTVCTGSTPVSLTGSVPVSGTPPFTYYWEQSNDGVNWTAASGTNNLQSYSPSALSSITYFRRTVYSSSVCMNTSISNIITIAVDQPPSAAAAGTNQQVCISSPSATMNANIPSIGTGVWSLVSGAGSIASPSSAATIINGLGVGSNIFKWTISNGVCPSTSSTVTISVDQLPTSSNAGIDQEVCISTGSAILNAMSPAVGTGLWSVASGTGVITSPSSASSNINSLSLGSNMLVWKITNGVCPSSYDSVSILVDALPTSAFAGNDQTICVSAGTAFLNANSPSIGSGMWSLISGSGSISNATIDSTTVNGISVGTNLFRWTIRNGVCPASVDTVKIFVDDLPSNPNAGIDQAVCITSSSAALNANVPGVGTGHWSLVSGTGIISSALNASTSVNGLSQGPNLFSWTVTNGMCASRSDTITVVVSPMPTTASAGVDQTICVSTGSTSLTANVPVTGSGIWSHVSGSGTITSPLTESTNITGLSAGVSSFAWTISNSVCPASSDTLKIFVDTLPDVSFAGADQELCISSASTTLNANNPVIGSGLWFVASGSALISSYTSSSSPVTGLGPGLNVLVWRITNGTCPSSYDSVSIKVDDLSGASFAGNDQIICVSTDSVILNANNPAIGNGMWAVISGSGNFSDVTMNNATVTNMNIGQNIFTWSISNGVCASTIDTLMVFVDAMPDQANAGADITACISSPSLNLNAVNPVIGNGQWSLVSGAGIISSPTLPNSSVSGYNAGSNMLTWTISNGVCASSTDTMFINIDALPSSALAGSDQIVCVSSPTVPLNANFPLVGTGIWNIISGTGMLSDSSSAMATLSGFNTGATILKWTIKNGVCPASIDTVIINADALPSISNAGTDQHVCENSATANLNANIPAVGTGQWSMLSGGGSFSSVLSPSCAVSGLLTGINSFEWTITNGVCPSSTSSVNITVDRMPDIAVAEGDQTICESNTSVNIAANVPVIGTGIWSVSSGSGSFTNSASAVSAVSGYVAGANVYTWNISNGVCPVSSSSLTVNVDALPGPVNAGSNKSICISDPSLKMSAIAPSVGTGNWAVLSGSGNFNSTSDPNATASGLGIGDNIFSWTVSNGVCPSVSSTVTISVDQSPDSAKAGIDRTLDIPFTQLQGNIPSVGAGQWSWVSGNGVISNSNDATAEISGMQVGVSILKWTISNGVCPPSSDEVTVTMNPLQIPNGFSPNGDAINDTYKIPALEYYPNVKFNVFNKWGNVVYSSDEYKNAWDGTNNKHEKLADDTYYFIMEVTPEMHYSGFIVLKTK